MKKPNLLLAALVQTILYITFCIVYRGLFIAGIMESGIMRFAHLFAGVFMYATGIDAAIAVDRKIFDRPKRNFTTKEKVIDFAVKISLAIITLACFVLERKCGLEYFLFIGNFFFIGARFIHEDFVEYLANKIFI